jgi:hypothetical protein
MRPTSRTSLRLPRTTGITSASQHSRRTAPVGISVPSSVTPTPSPARQVVVAHQQGEPGWDAVLVGQQVGGLAAPAGLGEGVEKPGAVVAEIAVVVAPGESTGRRIEARSRHRGGERHQGGLDRGGVLGGAAAPDPGPAGMVVGDGEVALEVRDPRFAVEGTLLGTLVALGVHHRHQVLPGLRQLRGVEPLVLLEHQGHGTGAVAGGGKSVDRAGDRDGLGGGQPAVAVRPRPGRRPPRSGPRPAGPASVRCRDGRPRRR